jgi:hypothetical protein
MFKKMDFIFVGLVLAVATATYAIKYGSEIEYNNISKLEHDIQLEKEAIDILKANWSLLTDPARIQLLSERHQEELKLETLNSRQVISFDQIPEKQIEDPEIRSARINGKDQTVTGSIKSQGGKQ